MTEAESRHVPIGPAPVRRSLWGILAESGRLYLHHGWPLTRVLILPMVYILIGMYSCLIISHWVINGIATHYLALAQQHLVLFLGLVSLIALGTLSLFFKGFWQYAVYWTSLNQNAQEALDGKPLDIRGAYQRIGKEKRVAYKLLLLAYGLLPGIGLVVFMLCSLLTVLMSVTQNGMAAGGLFLVGVLAATGLTLLWAILTIPMSLVFQVMVFQPTEVKNPVPVLLESARLVMKRPWTTLGLQVILFLATNYLLTMPVAFLVRMLQLTIPLDAAHRWIIGLILSGLTVDPGSDPGTQQIMATVQNMVPDLARGWTDATVMLTLTALLLPLGTFAFTLLYRDVTQAQVPNHSSIASAQDATDAA